MARAPAGPLGRCASARGRARGEPRAVLLLLLLLLACCAPSRLRAAAAEIHQPDYSMYLRR